MFPLCNYVIFCFSLLAFSFKTGIADILPPTPPSLMLYSPGELEYVDVLVKREYDNLTLVCEVKGDASPRVYVWNYVSANGTSTDRPLTIQPQGSSTSSQLVKLNLNLDDSGHYMCSSPPFSVTKYILVQTRGPKHCARGAFWCGTRCVLAMYVCDGRRDCVDGEDEAPSLCSERPCARADKLNCSTGRCVAEAACCRSGAGALCRQPACCDEHPRYSRLDGYVDVEYPALFEDRHAPDDYGFIQSTIYTVTACALIFMIAVVLLVSAICKMHMKRAALRSYAHAERATRQHYTMHYERAHRFPPCYEASRLLEQEARGLSPPHSPQAPQAPQVPQAPQAPQASQSPLHSPAGQETQQTSEAAQGEAAVEDTEQNPEENRNSGFGLSRLSALFTSRYRQVPTQPCDVEMTDVQSTSLNSSPTRNRTRTRLDNYRSPTYCDLNTTDFYFTNPDTGNCGRDLNYMATPLEFFRRRTLRGNTFDRVMDQLDRQASRPLTLHLGRFQLSIPRFTRQSATDRRPDTPNVAEINIDDLDFVRLNSNDTYTLNGRTIRLLGANFENYPVLSDSAVRPPPYTEAMRYKLYGPPPEYLSRDGLNNEPVTSNEVTNNVDEEARNNVEMPPRYEDLASGGDANANNDNVANVVTNNAVISANSASVDSETCNNNLVTTAAQITDNNNVNNDSINNIIDNLPAIDSDVNANESNSQLRIDNLNAVITVNNNE